MKKKTLIISIIILAAVFILRFGIGNESDLDDEQNNIDDNVIIEPADKPEDKSGLIRVETPIPDQTIKSPVMIKGEARGYWFFEGDFSVRLLDQNGKIMTTDNARAQTDWMTEDFVRFAAILDFPTPTTNLGTLILKKDNPSGLPENNDEVRIPVKF